MFYDNNQISIEDNTNIALTEDTPARYGAYGWHVQEVEGGENVVGIEEAIAAAKAVTDKPSFIAVRTIIGYPAPTKMNTGKAHGSALGDEEVAAVKEILGFDPDKTFEVRDEVIEHTRKLVARGKEAHEKWQGDFDAWAEREPERKKLLDRLLAQELPDGWDADLTYWEPGSKPLATRAAFGQVLNDVAPKLPELWGGSADLAGSNNTTIKGVAIVRAAVDLDQGATRRTGTAGCCTSACVSTRWARSCPASCCTARPAPSAARSCSSPTTCARRCVWHR